MKVDEDEEDEALPISRKDAALNSLVNFADLNTAKQNSEDNDSEPVDKPVYIDPS